MFGFFKKKTDPAVYAPVKGKCIDITEVNDEGFSSKIMVDGVAVIPEESVIKAPADGKLTMIFETGHAFGKMCIRDSFWRSRISGSGGACCWR